MKWNNVLFKLATPAMLFVSFQVLASADVTDCQWGVEGCLIVSPPVLAIDNDTRDNFLRLLSEKKALPLPVQPVLADVARSRDYYFAWHPTEDGVINLQKAPADVTDSDFEVRIKALGLDNTLFDNIKKNQSQLENRYVSNNLATLSAFYAALLAETTLTATQRHQLALSRVDIAENYREEKDITAPIYADNTSAAAFREYLLAARAFYQGRYDAAAYSFSLLKETKQPWVSETSAYMLIRTALNQSTAKAQGDYGEFDVANVSKEKAGQARHDADAYLKTWPKGQYIDSASGLLRRVDWYLQAWSRLAVRYERAFVPVVNPQALKSLVAENDSKLISESGQCNHYCFIAEKDAPLQTFIQTLRFMRQSDDEKSHPYINQQYLDDIKSIFETSGQQALWLYLKHSLAFRQHNYSQVISDIRPAKAPFDLNLLRFSEQVLYGDALMAQKRWSDAHAHWLNLLVVSKEVEQQQYVQAKLAATLLNLGDIDSIFAPDSPVTNLRYRSLILKTKASIKRLRQQVSNGKNNEERTIALHSLLVRDLTEGRYNDWLKDRALVRFITQSIDNDAFSDVDLATFIWDGKRAEPGYVCPSLEKIVTILSKLSNDNYALNCLGEFFRTTSARIDYEKEGQGNADLDTVTQQKVPVGQLNRQAYYQHIINDAKSTSTDKSYALYRAVMCYSPAGINECGGTDVKQSTRKRWFNQLNRDYPESAWAQKLKYYW